MFKPPGVHRRHHHERGRIGQTLRGPADADLAILKGLAQHFQYVLFEFGEFIKEKYTVVSQGDFTRTRVSAAADQAGVGDGVVRCAENALRDQRLARRQQAEDRMHLGDLERLFEGLRRQDRRDAPGQHRLATAGRTDHQDIVPPRRRDLEGALDVPLAAHFGEVDLIATGLADGGLDIDPTGLDSSVLGQKIDNLPQGVDRIDRLSADQRSFLGIVRRQDQAVEIPVARGHGHRQHTANRLDAAIQRELTHEQEAFAANRRDQLGRRQQSDRHRQIECRAFLADIRRGKIDGDPTWGEFVTGILDRGLDAVLAFLDRALRQADS
jgi:hypothetical protein